MLARKRQLVWSDGLRQLLALGVEHSDQAVAEELREDAAWMDRLTSDEWAVILGNDARAELLLVLGKGSGEELRAFLNGCGVQRPPCDLPGLSEVSNSDLEAAGKAGSPGKSQGFLSRLAARIGN
jgi:hypothetical protein